MAGNAGKGRPKGSKNKTTTIAREAIELVFDELGGWKAMAEWAREHRDDYYKLIYPKLLPVQLNHADNEGEKLEGFKVILVGKSS